MPPARKRQSALRFYQELENYSRNVGDTRLLSRVLRNQAELLRLYSEDAGNLLDELNELNIRTGYIFGEVYNLLSRGGISLRTGQYERAREHFEQARGLCVQDGQPLRLEALHCTLGLAEAFRLSGQMGLARELYSSASSSYRNRGVAWGYLRAELALRSLGVKRRPPGKDWAGRADWALRRLQISYNETGVLPSILENIL